MRAMSRKPGYRSILDRAIFKMALALCLPTFFVANAQHSSEQGQRQYAYDTADVSLEGKLVEKSAYGPPGFGETPKKDITGEIPRDSRGSSVYCPTERERRSEPHGESRP